MPLPRPRDAALDANTAVTLLAVFLIATALLASFTVAIAWLAYGPGDRNHDARPFVLGVFSAVLAVWFADLLTVQGAASADARAGISAESHKHREQPSADASLPQPSAPAPAASGA